MPDPITVPRWSIHITAGLAALATLAGLYMQVFPSLRVFRCAFH